MANCCQACVGHGGQQAISALYLAVPPRAAEQPDLTSMASAPFPWIQTCEHAKHLQSVLVQSLLPSISVTDTKLFTSFSLSRENKNENYSF